MTYPGIYEQETYAAPALRRIMLFRQSSASSCYFYIYSSDMQEEMFELIILVHVMTGTLNMSFVAHYILFLLY